MKKKRDRKNPKNFAIQVRMTQTMHDLVEADATKQAVSSAELIRRLLKRYYDS